jgi:tRNA1Val (adenine37-N6)-methyltransferase
MNISLKDNERIDKLCREMKIIQSDSTPCFAIDAVLLANFVHSCDADQIFDLGSGTGIIPLLLAHRMPNTKISGIEIMESMYEQSIRSIALNNLSKKIEIIHGDLRSIEEYYPQNLVDIVVANPPYFKIGHGKMNLEADFAAARQEQCCTLDDILDAASYLLRQQGHLYLIHRAERMAEILTKMHEHQLNPRRIRMVQPYANKNANLVLIEAKYHDRGNLVIEPPLIVYQSKDQYSKEMLDIYDR